MEIYKYILLIVGVYIAVCRIFKNLPICIENIFGEQISFFIQCIVAFGFLYWIFDEVDKRFSSKKEGWMSISAIKNEAKDDKDIDSSLIPSDVEDIPEVPCPTNPNNNGGASGLTNQEKKQLENLKKKGTNEGLSDDEKSELRKLRSRELKNLAKTTGEKDINPKTGLCHGQFADIPNGYYGFTITTREASDKTFKYESDKSTGKNIKADGKVVNEQKMRPLESIESDCKLKTNPDGKPTVERSVEPKSSSSDAEKCVNRINILKSQKDTPQYDPNKLNKGRTNVELTPNEKEDKQKNFEVDLDLVNPKPVYYEPGSYTFGASTYVPNYEQSVYLSKTTNISQTTPLDMTQNNSGGFCSAMQNDKIGLDKKCQSLDPDVCPSTSCCVLVGGQKCFAGDETGPERKSVFSDTTITNRDYYYYKSKCYGNCP